MMMRAGNLRMTGTILKEVGFAWRKRQAGQVNFDLHSSVREES